MNEIGVVVKTDKTRATVKVDKKDECSKCGSAIILLPLIMGVGYELIRVAGKHDNIITRIISAPGMWLQRITTKEPEDGMIECAIEAMKKVIPEDKSDEI